MRDFSTDLANLSSRDFIAANPFEALSIVADYLNAGRSNEGRELLFHLMEQDAIPDGMCSIQDSLLESLGLYPYLNPTDLRSTSGQIAYEAHRPLGDDKIVLHEGQLDAYVHLMNGESVVLSAPTSFGKSLLIDVLISSGRYRNVVVIVPTIALIDETRRRLSRKFGLSFKIITHPSQEASANNLYVLTQERYLELEKIPAIDLFVIDEFYKLNPDDEGGYDDRTIALNVAYMKLLEQHVQFLLIGPNIEKVETGDSEVKYTFIRSDFRTVGSNIIRVNANGRQDEVTFEICTHCDQQTLIFCASINRVYKLADYLIGRELCARSEKACRFADWLACNYAPDWSLVNMLRHGIAVHHSSLPRSVSQYILQLFNEGAIRFLLCTSTIIEGVNTSARNVIVYDNKIARRTYDYFTFCNIKGRAGRMLKHLVGRVYVLNPEPQAELPLVEIPALSLPEGIPLQLAMEAGEKGMQKLSGAELDKLKYLHAQHYLPVGLLRQNSPFDPIRQVKIAKEIVDDLGKYLPLLAWNGLPNKDQLKCLAELTFDGLLDGDKSNGVLSWKQLFFKLLQLQTCMPKGFDVYLTDVRRRDNKDRSVDELLREVLAFCRNWAEFQLPRAILALDRIQRHVMSANGKNPGDYSEYAEKVKHLFRHPAETILEEYGIPMSMTGKMEKIVALPESVDEIMLFMWGVDIDQYGWSDVEKDIYRSAFENNGRNLFRA